MARMVVYPDTTPAAKVGEASTEIQTSDTVGEVQVFTVPFGSAAGPRVNVAALPDQQPQPDPQPEPEPVQPAAQAERRPGRPRLPRDDQGRIIR